VWANDGKIAHDSNPDKAGSLLENYWNGADRKFAPGEIPDKKVAADKTGGPIDAPVEGMSDEALQNQMDYIDSISDKPPSWFSRKGELSREKDRRDVAAGTAANANSEMTMAKWDTMPLAERSSYNKMSDAEKKAYNQNAAKTSPVAEFDGPGFQQSAKGKVPPEFTSDRKLAQLELALNEAKPAGGTYTTWNIAGRNSLGMTFNGTEEQAKKRFANYDVYNVKHRLNRQDYTVSGWEDVATAGEPVDIPDSAPGVITSWRVSGPNSLGRAFLGTKEDAVKRLSEYERYTQYGNVHVLKKQELIPLPPVEVASTL